MILNLTEIERKINKNYWSTTLGLARSSIALCTLLTLFFNSNDVMFKSHIGNVTSIIEKINLFIIFGDVQYGKIVSYIILIFVIIGIHPRYTAIPHCWVTYSFFNEVIFIEGGDQVSMYITIFLVPILLFDKRKNHWKIDTFPHSYFSKVISFFCYYTVLIQVSVLYFSASTGKFENLDWSNGTAVYYWINDPTFGASGILNDFLNNILKNPYIVVMFTWGSLLVELFLFVTLFIGNQKVKIIALVSGILLHFFVIILFGLISFFFAMFGALILYTIWQIDLRTITNNIKNKTYAKTL